MKLQDYLNHLNSQDYPYILKLGRNLLNTILDDPDITDDDVTISDEYELTVTTFDIDAAIIEAMTVLPECTWEEHAIHTYGHMVGDDPGFYTRFMDFTWKQRDTLDDLAVNAVLSAGMTNPYHPVNLVPLIEHQAAQALLHPLEAQKLLG